MPKTVYHFCPKWMLESILQHGLTRGSILCTAPGGKVGLHHGYQWLTTNPNWDQTWCEQSSPPYKRNECRLTISIPDGDEALQSWLYRYCIAHPDPAQHILNSYGDPQNWMVYAGSIDPEWIVKIEENPECVMT